MQVARLDAVVVHVGDLELPAPRRAETPNEIEDALIVHVNAGHRVTALRCERLLFDPHDAIAVELRNAEALRIVDLFEQDARARALLGEGPYVRGDVVLDDVVAE